MIKAVRAETADAIQAFYPDDIAICYGCGRNNPNGLHLKTYWNGSEGICRFCPRPQDTAFPGFVYGGLIACLVDCHSVGTAIAAAYDAEGRPPGSEPAITFVTGTLKLRYLHPTPMDTELILKAYVKEQSGKKSIIHCSLYANDRECVTGKVVAVRAPWKLQGGHQQHR